MPETWHRQALCSTCRPPAISLPRRRIVRRGLEKSASWADVWLASIGFAREETLTFGLVLSMILLFFAGVAAIFVWVVPGLERVLKRQYDEQRERSARAYRRIERDLFE